MADEFLSDAEIEVLLGKQRTAVAPAERSLQNPPAQSALPPRLSEPLALVHRHCAREFAIELSALLRRIVRVRVVEIQESPDGAPGRRDASKGVWVYDVSPHLGEWQVSMAPDVLLTMIDCMLGGGREPAAPLRRPLTDIEVRLADRILKPFISALKAAWETATKLSMEFIPRRSAAAPSKTAFVRVQFELDMAAARGLMSLQIPLTTVALLLGQRNAAGTDSNCSTPSKDSNTVELVASLGDTPITPDELANLAIGDVITTDRPATEPIAVSQDGVVKFQARLGASQGRKALEIERLEIDSSNSATDTSEGG
jgi:flagellar motor switch protein FliM